MFNRKRKCKNPDCRIEFDPINPKADCHNKSCNNRMNHLIRMAKKLGIKSQELIWNYVIMRSCYDQRRITQHGDYLEELGVNFNAFPPPVPFKPGDPPSVLVAGDLGLVLIKDKLFRIVKKTN
ncbi:MAG: hypothetical protein ACK50A_00060 [Sphingobacteriaceae bacterium]|jgi:Iap family predicted aminopeptidase